MCTHIIIHGFLSIFQDDAEKFIDDAVLLRMEKVSIIHGKGTGVLRSAIHSMLKNHRQVKSFRLGVFGEGETGELVFTTITKEGFPIIRYRTRDI